MKTRLFRSGNSLAVRIPKELHFESPANDVEIERVGDSLVIRRVGAPLAAASVVGLSVAARQIADGLVAGLVTVDELVASTGLPVATVLASHTILERHGLAVGVHGRYPVAGTLAATA